MTTKPTGQPAEPEYQAVTKPKTEKETIMATVEYISLYDLRVKLVQETLTANSELTDDAARTLAIHVLEALDHIPEKRR